MLHGSASSWVSAGMLQGSASSPLLPVNMDIGIAGQALLGQSLRMDATCHQSRPSPEPGFLVGSPDDISGEFAAPVRHAQRSMSMGAYTQSDLLAGYGTQSSEAMAALGLSNGAVGPGATNPSVGSTSLQAYTSSGSEAVARSQRPVHDAAAAAAQSVRQRVADASRVGSPRTEAHRPLASLLGPAATATTTQAPSDSYACWVASLERSAEERLLNEARLRFCACSPEASLYDFKQWINTASFQIDEETLQEMRRAQLRCWMLCLSRKRRGISSIDGTLSGNSLPSEVRDRIDSFSGSRHVWGPINAARARAVAESALQQLRRSERVMRAAALAALVARYVHPAVVQSAEAGRMQCSTEIPTDDIALQALFEVTNIDVGAAVASHLSVDGFEVDPKYYDPEYGIWRGFWVDKCNRLRLTLMW